MAKIPYNLASFYRWFGPKEKAVKDTVEFIGRSLVQHGPVNNRIYLLQTNPEDVPWIIEKLDRLAIEQRYTKILARVSNAMATPFLDSGYTIEAVIPNYYRTNDRLLFISKFFSASRTIENHPVRFKKHFELISRYDDTSISYYPNRPGLHQLTIRPCTSVDCVELAHVFKKVFASYPFPVYDPDYLKKAMASHTCYICAEIKGRLVGVCAGEIDNINQAAEMTDFAVLPGMRGKGVAAELLKHLEKQMCSMGVRTAFTISRTLSPGMNIVFKQAKYHFGGTLINNTQIAGGIESMWVWYKTL